MYESFSRHLKEAREARGLSRRELARMARVPLLVVRNLEEGRWSDLPEAVYLRWFIERLAKVLDIPPSVWHPLIDELTPRVDLSSVALKTARPSKPWGWIRGLVLVLSLLVIGGFAWLMMKGVFLKGSGGFREEVKELVLFARGSREKVASKVRNLSSVTQSESGEAEAAFMEIHHLEIRAKGSCWVRMWLCNATTKDFVLKPGEKYLASFTKELKLKLGNPGAVVLIVDGKPFSFKRNLGLPKVLKVTPSGVVELSKGEGKR